MKKMKSILTVACAALFLFAGCKGEETSVSTGYLYKKQSADKLYFYSSDETLDVFLNDFYTRHSLSE